MNADAVICGRTLEKALPPAALIGKRKIPIFNYLIRNSAQVGVVSKVCRSFGFPGIPESGTD